MSGSNTLIRPVIPSPATAPRRSPPVPGVAEAARASSSSTARPPPSSSSPARGGAPFADLGLPAPDGAAGTTPASRVHREMSHLAGESGVTGHGPTRDDEAATDADLAGHEQHVVRSDAGTESRLGKRTEVGVVADTARYTESERLREHRGDRCVGPTEVRSGHDDVVDVADEARHRDAAPRIRRSRPPPRCTRRCSRRRTRPATSLTVSATATRARGARGASS